MMKRNEIQINKSAFYYFQILFIYKHVYMCVDVICVGVPKEARDIRYPGVGIIDSYELMWVMKPEHAQRCSFDSTCPTVFLPAILTFQTHAPEP